MTQDARHLYEREAIEQRYCEECRWFTLLAGAIGTDAARCTYPRTNTSALAMVFRSPPPQPLRWCDLERGNPYDTNCGPEAKFFEPRPAPISEAAE